jgi:hypothetical protein
LAVTARTKSSFEFLDATIWVAFALESPGGGKDVHTINIRDKFPTIQGLLKYFEFIEGGLIIFSLMFATESFLQSWVIFRVSTGFGGKGMGLDVINGSMRRWGEGREVRDDEGTGASYVGIGGGRGRVIPKVERKDKLGARETSSEGGCNVGPRGAKKFKLA